MACFRVWLMFWRSPEVIKWRKIVDRLPQMLKLGFSIWFILNKLVVDSYACFISLKLLVLWLMIAKLSFYCCLGISYHNKHKIYSNKMVDHKFCLCLEKGYTLVILVSVQVQRISQKHLFYEHFTRPITHWQTIPIVILYRLET